MRARSAQAFSRARSQRARALDFQVARARSAQNFLRARAQNKIFSWEIKDVNLPFYTRNSIIVCVKGIHGVNFDQRMRFDDKFRVENCKVDNYWKKTMNVYCLVY